MATFIYGLRDPTTNKIRYVGKTTDLGRRLREHIGQSGKGHLGCWLDSLCRRGFKPSIVVIQWVASDKWQEAERFWIAALKDAGANLVNGSLGGLGGSNKGHRFNPEGRARINAAVTAACKGRPLSAGHRRRLSEAHKGKVLPREHRRKISMANRRRYSNPAERAKTGRSVSGPRNGRYGIQLTESERQHISKSRRGKGLDNKSAAKPYPAFRNEWTGAVIPSGRNLSAMCREHDLNRASMQKVAIGKRRACHGWIINEEAIDRRCQL